MRVARGRCLHSGHLHLCQHPVSLPVAVRTRRQFVGSGHGSSNADQCDGGRHERELGIRKFMRSPAIHEASRRNKNRRPGPSPNPQQGITMVLVALAMIAIIAMAALSIDVVTLYLAREEAQRSADAAALRPRYSRFPALLAQPIPRLIRRWVSICGGSSSVASQTAQAVANKTASAAPYPQPSRSPTPPEPGPAANCSSLSPLRSLSTRW